MIISLQRVMPPSPGEEAMAHAAGLRPDVVLMDIG
jgi:hypothetical protein